MGMAAAAAGASSCGAECSADHGLRAKDAEQQRGDPLAAQPAELREVSGNASTFSCSYVYYWLDAREDTSAFQKTRRQEGLMMIAGREMNKSPLCG